jgi:malate dehydrogenase
LDHMRNWVFGTPEDDWVSMAVQSDGSYGIEPGLVFSYPVEIRNGHCHIVAGLEIDEFSSVRIKSTEAELSTERDMVRHLIKR